MKVELESALREYVQADTGTDIPVWYHSKLFDADKEACVYLAVFKDGHYTAGVHLNVLDEYVATHQGPDGADFTPLNPLFRSYHKSDIVAKLVVKSFDTFDEAYYYEASLVTPETISTPQMSNYNPSMYDRYCLNRFPGGAHNIVIWKADDLKSLTYDYNREINKHVSQPIDITAPWTTSDIGFKLWSNLDFILRLVHDYPVMNNPVWLSQVLNVPVSSVSELLKLTSYHDRARVELPYKDDLLIDWESLYYIVTVERYFPDFDSPEWLNISSAGDKMDLLDTMESSSSVYDKLSIKKCIEIYLKGIHNGASVEDTVYICSPLFTEEDNATLDRVESILDNLPKTSYFSPRKGDASVNFNDCKSREERAKLAYSVYVENVNNLDSASLVLVNVDSTTFIDKNSRTTDVGTAFEMGYAAHAQVHGDKKVRIVTFSSKGYGTNIMLQCTSDCHLPDLDKLESFLTKYKQGQDYDELCNSMSMFNGALY